MRKSAAIMMVLLVSIWVSAIHAEQVQSHPLLSPYKGSTFLDSANKGQQRFEFALAEAANHAEFAQSVTKEGMLSHFVYELPEGKASALAVFRNYEQALVDNGANILFTCVNQACRGKDDYHLVDVYNTPQQTLLAGHEVDQFASLTASLRHKGDEYFVLLIAGQFKDYTKYELVILEVAELKTGLVSVDLIDQNLFNQGKVALYGIYFDSGKADIKPESEPQLSHIQQFLTQNPKVSLFVVGHTDNDGDKAFNMALSQQRAKAVVEALIARKIAASRLSPEGVGPLAPVATNSNEKGKAQNRRVELVLR